MQTKPSWINHRWVLSPTREISAPTSHLTVMRHHRWRRATPKRKSSSPLSTTRPTERPEHRVPGEQQRCGFLLRDPAMGRKKGVRGGKGNNRLQVPGIHNNLSLPNDGGHGCLCQDLTQLRKWLYQR